MHGIGQDRIDSAINGVEHLLDPCAHCLPAHGKPTGVCTAQAEYSSITTWT